MPRTTKTITFSLSPEMSERLDALMSRNERTRSELIREALERYMEEWEWRDLLQYGEQRAREAGIDPEDVSRLIAEYRTEMGPRSG